MLCQKAGNFCLSIGRREDFHRSSNWLRHRLASAMSALNQGWDDRVTIFFVLQRIVASRILERTEVNWVANSEAISAGLMLKTVAEITALKAIRSSFDHGHNWETNMIRWTCFTEERFWIMWIWLIECMSHSFSWRFRKRVSQHVETDFTWKTVRNNTSDFQRWRI